METTAFFQFPNVMAAIEYENNESVKWFLELLIDELNLGEATSKTLISDQQKVLVIA